MSDNGRHGKRAKTPRSHGEPVDYTDFATEPAVEIDTDTGQRIVKMPDGQSVTIDYDAARRRPAPPPNFNLTNHYDPPTNVDGEEFNEYEGPENFAPTAQPSAGPKTIPLTMKKPEEAWDSMPSATGVIKTRAGQPQPPRPPTADSQPRAFHDELTDDDVPTNQWEGRDLANQLSPAVHEGAVHENAISGGLSGTSDMDGVEVVAGIPSRQPPPAAAPEPAPRRPAQPQREPRRPLAPPPIGRPAARPQLPMRPKITDGTEDEIDTNVMERLEEPSGVFIADEYEAAAIRRSTWMYVVALLVVGGMLTVVATIVLLAFAGGGAVKIEQLIRDQISAYSEPASETPSKSDPP